MSSKTIKLILAIILGIPAVVVAFAAGLIAFGTGTETVVAAPTEVGSPADPIILGDVDAQITVAAPADGAKLPEQRDTTRARQLETVKHLATVQTEHGEYNLYTFDEIVTDTATNRESLEHCVMAFEGTDGGGMCSLDEFTTPQYIQFNSLTQGSTEVALFYAELGSHTMTVETSTGYVVSSNLVNEAGFVQYDSANGKPKWITLFDSSGLAIWIQQVS